MLQTKTWLAVRRPCAIVPPTRKPGYIRCTDAAAAVCCRGSGRWSRGGRRPCRNEGTAILLSAYRSSCLRSSSRMRSTRAMSQLNRMSRSSSRCRRRLLFFGIGDSFSYRMSSVRRSRPAPPPPPMDDGGDGVGGGVDPVCPQLSDHESPHESPHASCLTRDPQDVPQDVPHEEPQDFMPGPTGRWSCRCRRSGCC